MSGIVDFLNARAVSWSQLLAPLLWQATFLALLIVVVVKMGRSWSSPLRYGILLLALLKFVAPPVWSSPTGLFSFVHAPIAAMGLVVADVDEPDLQRPDDRGHAAPSPMHRPRPPPGGAP